MVRTVSQEALFGIKPVWRNTVKVNVSDPTQTILDMLDDRGLGGGLRLMVDVL
jgi:predicted transcriptional regulator of viral defense system